MPEFNHNYYSPVELDEQGFSGTRIFSGILTTDEWLPEMSMPERVDTVNKMRTDSTLSAIEKGFSMPIIQSDHDFSYPRNENLVEPVKQKILDFIKDNFSRINMPETLRWATLSFPYGFSVSEPVFYRNAGKICLKSIEPRMHNTIYKWWVEGHGKLKSVEQLVYAYDPDGKTGTWKHIQIPADNILLFSHMPDGRDFTGRSELRSLYREWLIKDRTLKQAAITIERVGGGIPTAIISKDAPQSVIDPVSGRSIGVSEAIENALKGLQADENSYLVLKWVEKLDLLHITPDALKNLFDVVIKYCDEAMVKTAFQLFMSLGGGNSGNKALGDTFINLYYDSVVAMAAEITSAINSQLIRRLVDWNFGVQDVYPEMSVTIDRDMLGLVKGLSEAKQRGLIEGNHDMENFILNYFGMPLTTEANKLAPSKPQPLLAEKGHRSHGQAVHLSSRPGGLVQLNREPTPKENQCINLAETVKGLNSIVEGLSRDIRGVAEPVMMEMAKQIGNGAKVYAVKPTWGKRISNLFVSHYRKLRTLADQHVRKELGKQKPAHLSEIMLAGKKIPGADQPSTEAEFDKWIEDQADIESEMLGASMTRDLMKYVSEGKAAGYSGKDLTDFLIAQITDEVGQRWDSAAGDVVGGYAMAREISAAEFSDIIDQKIRTEIMDSGTCEVCADGDGEEHDLDDDSVQLPDPDCEGAPKCRGIWIYSVKEGA